MLTNSTPPPPPRSWTKALLLLALAAILLGAAPALAQTTETPAIADIEVTETGADCAWVEWDLVGSWVSLTIYRSTDPATVFTNTADSVALSNPGARSHNFASLTAETTYYFAVAGTPEGANQVAVQSDIISGTTLAAGAATCDANPPSLKINMEIAFLGSECLWLSWRDHPDATFYSITVVDPASIDPPPTYQVEKSPYQVEGLTADTEYTIANTPDQTALAEQLTVTTLAEDTPCPSQTEILALLGLLPPASSSSSSSEGAGAGDVVPTPRPLANTCPNLLPEIVVSGFVSYASQCQVVDGGGVGRMDLVNRGIVSAVDIWSLVPNTGVEVCFANMGAAVVFLDAAYSPRLLSSLEYAVRDGHTCTTITTTGTVVLLAS